MSDPIARRLSAGQAIAVEAAQLAMSFFQRRESLLI